MMYDVTAPESPAFVQYTNSSDVKEGGVVGDISPEGLLFVQASDSPNGRALLVVSHEVSGTVTIYEVD
jgi:hypothetical protein